MHLSSTRNFTLFIDEFQNFQRVNPSVFNDMQKIWDLNSSHSKINLIMCGSVYSMMTKLFRDKKEPLYNRQNRFMTIKAFPPSILKKILQEQNPKYENEDLLALYSFTGGVAKYVQLLIDDGATSKEAMIEAIVSSDSIFINEGKAFLIEEFGKEYDIYFSILTAISSGKTRRSEIESIIDRQVSGYLSRLEEDYGIIKKYLPVGAKPLSKNAIYIIQDNFLLFWFRFIFKHFNYIEIEAYGKLKELINRDYTNFTGVMLERYFRAKAIEKGDYTMIGSWWDRKGENEIDMIAADEIGRKVEFIEIKRNRKNINFTALKQKAETFLASSNIFPNFSFSVKGLDIQDM